ncbi:BTB/POZ and MATH domain-containing protein 3-like [Panicum hallii]|jgi:speckle-type POZ protein|uniref:BTB/POZ and MATH domain-containing protein 3-like n=1 Tax=Panicum hallii TaxID=206008 RepID=UPI000DF4ED36|nr:BTB/POZ and MATH domain-containing protein 3-like [Panicum hallii]
MPKPASRCGVEASRGAHVFEVGDYSLHKGLGVGRFVHSATFDVGGYEWWSVLFYPDGSADTAEDCVAAGLELRTIDARRGDGVVVHLRADLPDHRGAVVRD